jgi:hypothetical protein
LEPAVERAVLRTRCAAQMMELGASRIHPDLVRRGRSHAHGRCVRQENAKWPELSGFVALGQMDLDVEQHPSRTVRS